MINLAYYYFLSPIVEYTAPVGAIVVLCPKRKVITLPTIISLNGSIIVPRGQMASETKAQARPSLLFGCF